MKFSFCFYLCFKAFFLSFLLFLKNALCSSSLILYNGFTSFFGFPNINSFIFSNIFIRLQDKQNPVFRGYWHLLFLLFLYIFIVYFFFFCDQVSVIVIICVFRFHVFNFHCGFAKYIPFNFTSQTKLVLCLTLKPPFWIL